MFVITYSRYVIVFMSHGHCATYTHTHTHARAQKFESVGNIAKTAPYVIALSIEIATNARKNKEWYCSHTLKQFVLLCLFIIYLVV